MQNIDVPYTSLEDALRSLKQQVIDSLPFMSDYIPSDIERPSELFSLLRANVKYKSDPVVLKGEPGRLGEQVELIQTVPTLFKRGGKGDCDCFTVLTLASNWYLNFGPQYVALVGNTRKGPTHIYSEVYDLFKKKICAMDLTNPTYCMERPYKYKQRLKFNI